jgi:hypothetical protein
MRPRIYIETSVVSYLTARPSRDIVVAAHQVLTQDFWHVSRSCDFLVSQLVIDEAGRGDGEAAKKRLDALKEVGILDVTAAAIALGDRLVTELAIPRQATDDAYHVAIAAVNAVDYLASWNCTHIVNLSMRRRIENICLKAGYTPALIGTPEELLASLGEE